MAALRGTRVDKSGPDVAVHLGYLMPTKTWIPWQFPVGEITDQTVERVDLVLRKPPFLPMGRSTAETVQMMVDAIATYGVPYMQQLPTLEHIVTELDTDGYHTNLTKMQISVAYRLLGREEEARDILLASLEDASKSEKALANRPFRAFAYRFLGDVDRAREVMTQELQDAQGLEAQGGWKPFLRTIKANAEGFLASLDSECGR